MADVVQQSGDVNEAPLMLSEVAEVAALLEERERTSGQMIRAQRMLKSRMAGARIHQENEPELPHVPQPLKRRRIDQSKRERVDTDVVPEGVADDLHKRSTADMGHGRWDMGIQSCAHVRCPMSHVRR